MFQEFNWPLKEKFPSFLEVNLAFCNRSVATIRRGHFSRAPWEQEMALNEWSKNEPIYIDEKAPETDISENFKMQSWEKFIDLPSMLPDQRAWKLESEKQGVLRVAFSNKGRYLAMACTMKESQTIIKIADMESGKFVVILRGHHDLIHDLHFNSDDNFLVSGSADGSCKVWNLNEKEIYHANNLNYAENDEHFFYIQLLHPSFVYGAKFYPDIHSYESRNMYVATVCFDQKVRIWGVPNSLALGDDIWKLQKKPMIEMSILDMPLRTV